MKNLLFICMFLPFLGLSQPKTVFSVSRAFPKPDKIVEFENALKNHAQKYHTGTWKWRVSTVESGPDAGGYQILEGPTTWDEVDKRGDLGAEHMNDWMKNVMPLTTEKSSADFVVFREDLSSVSLTDYTDKIAITHVFPKPGRSSNVEEVLKQARKVWQESNQTIAIYEASASGPPQFILVTRYKQGLKERERDFIKPFKDRFISIYDQGAFSKYMDDIINYTNSSWSELLFYRADLSSK